MTADLNHVMTVVETIMTDEMPSGVHLLDGHTVYWRVLDDGENDSQFDLGLTDLLAEFEFVDADNVPAEYGAPGYNRHQENGAVMVHTHAPRGKRDIIKAKALMTAVINTLCRRQVDGVQFRGALASYVDSKGNGLTRGVSRAIKYQYEYRGR